jgi:hypothetical protein
MSDTMLRYVVVHKISDTMLQYVIVHKISYTMVQYVIVHLSSFCAHCQSVATFHAYRLST